MFNPALLPGVEEGHESMVEGISSFDLIVFVTITRREGVGQISQSRAPTFGPWHNMLDSKRTRHEAVWGVTVLTEPTRPGQHGLSLPWRDTFRCHIQAVLWPTAASVAAETRGEAVPAPRGL